MQALPHGLQRLVHDALHQLWVADHILVHAVQQPPGLDIPDLGLGVQQPGPCHGGARVRLLKNSPGRLLLQVVEALPLRGDVDARPIPPLRERLAGHEAADGLVVRAAHVVALDRGCPRRLPLLPRRPWRRPRARVGCRLSCLLSAALLQARKLRGRQRQPHLRLLQLAEAASDDGLQLAHLGMEALQAVDVDLRYRRVRAVHGPRPRRRRELRRVLLRLLRRAHSLPDTSRGHALQELVQLRLCPHQRVHEHAPLLRQDALGRQIVCALSNVRLGSGSPDGCQAQRDIAVLGL
mmetsp:Transcript_21267/g.59954  ORF Transcript_21267/g.59954 Transcript_21267/m.59954 type:complete len:294 (+) Transcript_21267:256-1137(+)